MKGEIIRTHLMRPTWHFVAPEDIRWLLELTAPQVNRRSGPNYRKFELDGRSLQTIQQGLDESFAGRKTSDARRFEVGA